MKQLSNLAAALSLLFPLLGCRSPHAPPRQELTIRGEVSSELTAGPAAPAAYGEGESSPRSPLVRRADYSSFDDAPLGKITVEYRAGW